MQKKRKIIISIAISLGLALAATQISNNGGLQSAVLSASLQSCKTGAITSIERCRDPLTTEKNRIQKEIDALNQQITAKKTECANLDKMKNRASQAKTCKKQLTALERDKTTKTPQLTAISIALSKLVSEAPLQAKRLNAQTELDAVKAQIVTKLAECRALNTQKKTAQAATCNQQLNLLYQTQTTKQKALIAATDALKKVAGAAAVPVTPALPVTPVIPTPQPIAVTPVIPVQPTTPYIECCGDMNASNYDITCMAPKHPNPALCTYVTSLGCQDPTAPNYGQAGPCMPSVLIYGCTSVGAINYNSGATSDNGSCAYPITGCTDLSAHNYNPLATQGDFSCQTCTDKIQNGDETGMDCGGIKCEKCPENNPITFIDSGNIPQYYCDVPGAVNYEKHEGDSNYIGYAYACNFCGNETREGVVLADGTTQPETKTGDGGSTVQVAEECEDGKDDKPYDGCYQCRLETCGDELALCRAYKFTGGEDEGDLSSRLTKGVDNNAYSKRPEWNNHHVDVVTTKGRDFATFGATCIRNKDTKIVSYTGYRTVFGLNVDGSIDTGDNGWGSTDYGNVCRGCNITNFPKQIVSNGVPLELPPTILTGESGNVSTRNKGIRGVAVPKEMLREIFSTDVNYRRVRVDVTGPKGCFRYPIVDEGPHEYTWARKCSAILDMTYATAAELGLLADTAKPTEIKWKIIENAGEDFRNRLTDDERSAFFTNLSFGETHGYNYRKYTQIEYPLEYFTPTPCN